MSWNDYYRRRDVLNGALRQARRDPARRVSLTDVPGATEVFEDEGDLLLALQYKWNQSLTGRIGVALSELAAGVELDNVDAVSAAWHRTAREHGTLREVLDANAEEHAEALRPGREVELRMLALAAGLAEPGEQPEKIKRVGAAFLGLLCNTPEQPVTRHRTPMRQLRRLLAPAG
ncbi:MAG: hypothetical protein GEU98_19400 [Pseudonocardiaceae bacterium]|nr:hypothetical protein [Pseudonocardiaceae bacterium]